MTLNLTGTDNQHKLEIFQMGVPRISRDETITAHAGGGNTSATAMNAGINVIATCASDHDSVKLPVTLPTSGAVPAGGGQMIVVINVTAHSADVYPQVSDYMNGTQDLAFTVAAGKVAIFFCGLDNKWQSLLTA